MKKKALSLLLVLAMCLTLLPTAALAANEPLDGTKGINITSSNMEDVTWTDGRVVRHHGVVHADTDLE